MKIKKYTYLIFLLTLFSLKYVAQTVYAQVSSKQVQVGVPFEYAIVINTNPNNYTPPNFKDFDIVSGPNQSSSMQWVNGQTSTQMTLSWALVAKKEGKATIGTAYVTAGSQRFETNAITLDVTKGAATTQQNSTGANDDKAQYNKVSGGDVFIRTGISKSKCVLGEQITIIQKVYSRLPIVGFQKVNPPTYDGFYMQLLESPTKGQIVNENVDGVMYQTYELFRHTCIANKAGKLSLAPAECEIVVRKQTNSKPKNIFEQFFGTAGYEDIPVSTKSRPTTVEVVGLPEEGKPASFSGAVGNYNFKVEASRTELKANDAFNLKMTVSGKGNLKLVDPPKPTLPEGFETYDPKIVENGNSKTFDYLVIPRSEGDYVLKDLDFSYFNLESKKYITISPEPITIKVLPPDPNSTGAQVYTPQNQVKASDNDIRYIKKGNFELVKTETEFFNSPVHFALLAFPLLALLGGLIVRRNHIKNNSNMVLVKERKAAKVAKKQLVLAEKLMQQNNKDGFYTEILLALNNYISNKLNIPVADLSQEHIQKTLTIKQVDETINIKLIATLQTSEYAKYAPGAVSGDLQAVYKDTIDLITNLEEQLNKIK
ncbi:MAG: BatD family protein [Bacteroidota bacterium]|nr:BatD family protein [Bacteroidota bacterium]